MDWKFWAPFIASSVQAVFCVLAYRLALKHMKMTLAPARVQEVNQMPWYKTYWPILAMFVAMVGSWSPYFFQPENIAKAYRGCGPVGPLGGNWPMPGISPEVQVVVDGRELWSYKKTHHIAGVAFHWVGSHDADDIKTLQKSALYDIRQQDINVIIPVSGVYMDEIAKGYRMTNYSALLVPNSVRMEDFDNLRQAYKLGVVLIAGAAGPP